ncbi:DUF3347 domain-containing protein [Sphingobacterium spiritivorum]|uniref:DUF3347 domain-containing protein n=1 Tax=Sphingobacterium spiritivorum TaxID=258 RepID=UPI003DA62499
MKSFKNILSLILLSGIAATPVLAAAQIKNAKTESIRIEGNAEACKTLIEKAGSKKGEAELDWNTDTKKAELTYNSQKTSKDEVLKRVALAGFDNEMYLAPTDVYQALSPECQYKGTIKTTKQADHASKEMDHSKMDHAAMNHSAAMHTESKLEPLYKNYFMIKEALIKGDSKAVTLEAAKLKSGIAAIKMSELQPKEHDVWMMVMKDLEKQAAALQSSKGLEKQRIAFMTLSEHIYKLIKATDPAYTVYYNHCPMFNDSKGANWLSKEKVIQNPYYGSQMLTCGSTKETIK